MTEIKCPNCGAINDYYTELKANNNVARCTQCDTFIKNIPYQTEKVFYFGKYKGQKVNDIEDINYLQWVLDNTKQKAAMKDAIIKQIDNFKNLAR
jgi:DNA-directed RNA polymerase subunit RPC12/RpoP